MEAILEEKKEKAEGTLSLGKRGEVAQKEDERVYFKAYLKTLEDHELEDVFARRVGFVTEINDYFSDYETATNTIGVDSMAWTYMHIRAVMGEVEDVFYEMLRRLQAKR